MSLKVFEIRFTDANQKAWVSANNPIHALRVLTSATDTDLLIDFEDNDDVVEILKSEWKNYFIENEGSEKTPFSLYMKNNVIPDIICQTA